MDIHHYRAVLGHLPTGVSIVAGRMADGRPNGLAVGSFSSVSLAPPLVAFMVATTSTSWPTIRDTGRLCVSVLSHDQSEVCAALSRSGGDKFAGVDWAPSAVTAAPRIRGAHSWVDCEVDSEIELGDHYLVVGRVLALEAATTEAPLVFYRGGYHGIQSVSAA